MNVHDNLKSLPVEEIKKYFKSNTIPAAAAMMHVSGDFNLSTLIRNANFFGLEKVFYVGGSKRYDKRGTVGTHHYVDVDFIKSERDFVVMAKNCGYSIIAIENNVNESQDFFKYFNSQLLYFIKKPMFLFGEEQKGLSDYVLSMSDYVFHVEGRGTVRSLNVGTTSGIIFNHYSNLYGRHC